MGLETLYRGRRRIFKDTCSKNTLMIVDNVLLDKSQEQIAMFTERLERTKLLPVFIALIHFFLLNSSNRVIKAAGTVITDLKN